MKVTVHQYNSFTTLIDKGNPAGVVLQAEQLSDFQMQEIARLVGFNETAFVLKSNRATVRLRYYTPGHEMNLCGHGTVAAIYGLVLHGILKNQSLSSITIETAAGILSVFISDMKTGAPMIYMEQAAPEFVPFTGSRAELAALIGITEDELHPELPIVYGSTGTWTLLVPIQSLDSFSKMRQDTQRFPSLLKELPSASIHPFCLGGHDPLSNMHGRHFSSPYSGTEEDAVTGTASGVMGAYYAKYIRSDEASPLKVVVEQGHEVGREGKVFVDVENSEGRMKVMVGGNCVPVREFQVEITANGVDLA